jgi:hypothetical protein
MHPNHDHVLIVGAVEDADNSRRWQSPLHPPQEMMLALLAGRLLERVILHAHGIHEPEDMLDRGSLASGVHALEDEQQAAPATGMPLGVELLLQVRQVRTKVANRRCGVGLS